MSDGYSDSDIYDSEAGGVKRNARGHFVKGSKGGPGTPPKIGSRIDKMYLAGAIRRMLEEELDEATGLPKLLTLINVAYRKAADGDSDAMKLLFERGYGKTPPAYQQDPRILLEQICLQSGMTIEELENDPIAAGIFRLLDENRGSEALALESGAGVEAGTAGGLQESVLESA